MDWLALVIPPLMWARAAALPTPKTYRHRLSGILSLVTGGLSFAALRVDGPAFPVVFGLSVLSLVGMITVLFWRPRVVDTKRTVR